MHKAAGKKIFTQQPLHLLDTKVQCWTRTVNREIFVFKYFHAKIFHVKILSYASRPYENILTKFSTREFRVQHYNYVRRDSWKSCVRNRVFVAIILTESWSWRGFVVREGSPQRGGSILCSLHATLAYDLLNFLVRQSNSL